MAAVSADLHAVEGDVDAVRLEVSAGGADRREHPAPVGVLAEDRALEEVAAGDRSAHLDRVVLRRCVLHLDGDGVRGTLGVGSSCRARS